MKEVIFTLTRDAKSDKVTLGVLKDPQGNHFCYTLEDITRPYGVKIKKQTAIPATEGNDTYKLGIRYSPKYGRVVVVYTSYDERTGMYILEYGGIRFEMILMHGGNDENDTEGCILVNKYRNINTMKANGTMKNSILEEVDKYIHEGYDVRLKITNLV